MLERCRSTMKVSRQPSSRSSFVRPAATRSSTSSSRALSSPTPPGAFDRRCRGRRRSRQGTSATRARRPQDVVLRIEEDEPRAGNQRSEQPAFLDGHGAVVSGMDHQGLRAHPRCDIDHVDPSARLEQPRGGVCGRRAPEQIVVLRQLLRRAFWQEQQAEQAAKRRIWILPAGADRRHDCLFLPVAL